METLELAEIIYKALAKQGESFEHVGDNSDLESVCLDGWFNLVQIAEIVLTKLEESK